MFSLSHSSNSVLTNIVQRLSKVPSHVKVRPLLSRREAEVLKYVGYGVASSTIAKELGLSVKTIDSHKEHLKLKLSCSGRDLVIAAHQFGLCHIEPVGQLLSIYPDICDLKSLDRPHIDAAVAQLARLKRECPQMKELIEALEKLSKPTPQEAAA